MKTLVEQNKQQFSQIGKLEGQIQTLTTLVKDIFKSTVNSEPIASSEANSLPNFDYIVNSEPTINSFNTQGTETPVISSVATSNRFQILSNSQNDVNGLSDSTKQADVRPNTPVLPYGKDPTSKNRFQFSLTEDERNISNTQPTMLPSGKDHTPPSKILEERNTVNTQLIMFKYAKDRAPMNKYQLNLGEEERNSVNLQTISSRPINSEVKSWADGMDKEHPNKVNKMSHSLNPFKVPSTHSSAPKKSNITVNSDIIMIMDSNGTHIDPNLLYPVEGSTDQKLFCPLLENVDELLEDSMFENIPTLTVLHCGTNNLDHADPRSAIENLTNTAKNLSKKLFSSKIIVSGILPRSDFEKSEIYTMKIELTKRLQFLPNVHFINHYSLLFRKSNVTM